MENALKNEELTPELLREAKRIEFPDNVIARLTGKSEREIHDMRHENGIVAAYKIVDTCAAEFAAETPYYYSVYGSENEVEETSGKKKVLVLGSGPTPRTGNRVRLLFRALYLGVLKRRVRDDHRQQQPGDRKYGLRHCGQAVFRASHAGRRGEHR